MFRVFLTVSWLWKIAGAWFASTILYSRCKKMLMNCSILRPARLRSYSILIGVHLQFRRDAKSKAVFCLLIVRKAMFLQGRGLCYGCGNPSCYGLAHYRYNTNALVFTVTRSSHSLTDQGCCLLKPTKCRDDKELKLCPRTTTSCWLHFLLHKTEFQRRQM